MIDPAILRTAPQTLRESLARRGSKVDVDELIELEASLRRTRQQAEEGAGPAERVGQSHRPAAGGGKAASDRGRG